MKNYIYTTNTQKAEPITPAARALIKRAISATLAYEGFEESAEVSVTFVDNEQIRELNREHRGKDSATDVLSFPMMDEEDGEYDRDPEKDAILLGDIVISVERARAQAEEYGHSFEREMAFLAVHSTLHLLGYDHERSAEDDLDQRTRQEAVLVGMGLTRETNTTETGENEGENQ